MLNALSVTNYKCLRNIKPLGLERFTVFVGANGSGKSSILKAIDFLCQSFRSTQQTEQNLDSELFKVASRGSTEPVELVAESNQKMYRYRTRPPNAPAVQPARIDGNPAASGRGEAVATKLPLEWKAWALATSGSLPLPNSTILRLDTAKLASPNHPNLNQPVMSQDGTGLHAALAAMALNDPDSWIKLQAKLHRMIPTIRRVRHKPQVQQPTLLFDTVGGDDLPADQVSEGTLLILGLLAAMQLPARAELVLLDDLDRGLHPKAQKDLVSLLRELLAAQPNLQIISTTHSPYLLDCLAPQEVRITVMGDDGATVAAPLMEHPKFQKWKDEMTPGEMWSMFGEKWITEKRVVE